MWMAAFIIFSEGGLKFKDLKENKNVGIAIFEPYGGFGQLKSLQMQGVASMIEPFSDEYLKLMEHKHIPVEAMKKLPQAMNLIKVFPESYEYLKDYFYFLIPSAKPITILPCSR